jgi:AbrB family looped-hinge helix DNA binding protein
MALSARIDVEYTKASSKGQVVIPSKIRKKLKIDESSIFAVAAQNDMIVLKKLDRHLSTDDLNTIRLIEEAWRDMAKGRYKVRSNESFFEELKKW